MTSLIPYLVFPGTCRQAMAFYANVLGGEITLMQTFEDAPVAVPDELRDRIFNSELRAGDLLIKASDDLPNHSVTPGTNFSLFAVFPDSETKIAAFEALSEEGKVLFPIDDNFGMSRDKFGVQWMFVHESC